MTSPAAIERFLHEQIPLTRAMEVRVESFGAGGLVLTAPLAPNHNHLGTAFGGSLAALATLAGYALVWLEFGDRGSHVVIRDSAIRYVRPVRGNLRAVCARPEQAELEEFRTQFTREGKSRLRLRVIIEEDGEAAVEFEGTFVALAS